MLLTYISDNMNAGCDDLIWRCGVVSVGNGNNQTNCRD